MFRHANATMEFLTLTDALAMIKVRYVDCAVFPVDRMWTTLRMIWSDDLEIPS